MSVRDVVAADPLLSAAFDAFARNGFKRSTMGDVAEAAHMSRPALYLRVSNKEELLRLVAGALLADSLKQAQHAAAEPGTLGERLEGVLTAKFDLTLALIQRSEHAAELLAQYRRIAPGYDTYTRDVEELLAELMAAESTGSRQRWRDIARALLACVRGLENELGDDPELARRELHELAVAVAAGLRP